MIKLNSFALFLFLSIGISQNYPPVVEMWTRTTWSVCPYARAALLILQENNEGIVLLWEMDNNTSPGQANRRSIYGVNGEPFQVFSGVFQEMSIYLSIAKHGVFQFITRIELLENELVKQNLKNKKLERKNIGRSKKGWILEIADDAEEEAEFQCNRMDFLERKARTLTKQLINN